MREIKFRAWILPIQKMQNGGFAMATDGSFWQYADQGYYVNNLNADDAHKTYLHEHNIPIQDEFILMQFTGLLDKHRKEIYEGDVLRVDDDYGKFGFAAVAIGPVIFDKGKFMLSEKNGNGKWYFEDNEIDYVQVIGNIYENPELLKDTV